MNLDFRREAWTRDKDFGVTISSGQNSYVEALTASTQNYDCIPKWWIPRTPFVLMFGLWPCGWHKAPKPLCISYVTIVSFVWMRWLWVGSCMGAGPQKEQGMVRSSEFSAPPFHSLERREGLQIELIMDHAYLRMPRKNPDSMGFRELPGQWMFLSTRRVMHPNSMGTEAPNLETVPDLVLLVSSSVFFIVCSCLVMQWCPTQRPHRL